MEGTINAPLLRLDTGKTDEAKMVVDPSGLSAETRYTVLKTSLEMQSAKCKVQNEGIINQEQLDQKK